LCKAEQIPGTTTGTTWAAPLIPAATALGDFIDLLRPATLIGQIPNLREVPFNVSVPVQSGGGTYTWVGELVAKPVSGLALATVTLRWAKVAGIIPFTKELMRFSNPAVEILIRNDMVQGMSQYLDEQFVDPTVNESINVSPASITAGINPTPATGTTATAFRTDMKTVFAVFNAALQTPTFILMSNTVSTNLSMMVNATTSMAEFPTLTPNGGTLWGIPVYVSKSVGTQIVVGNAAEILIARDGGVEIDVSQEASLVMTTTPESSPQATSLVSLYQRNLVAIRAEIFVTWKKARTSSVHRISNALYS
jgi:HK97 family phage major capsid protein